MKFGSPISDFLRRRPVVIVSRHDDDAPRALAVYVPLTTQDRMSAYEIAMPRLPFLDQSSVANVQGLGSIPTVRLGRRLGHVPQGTLTQIRHTLKYLLELDA